MTNLRDVTTPVPASPPRHSLLASAVVITESSKHWEAGFTWNNELCLGDILAFDLCSSSGLFDDVVGPTEQSYTPYGIMAAVECSTFTREGYDVEAHVKRLLTNGESKAIASELWNGTLAQANTYDNEYLASGVAVTQLNSGSATQPVQAIAELEEYLSECRDGGRGMIHVTRRTLVYLWNLGLLRREGALFLTPLDTIVVADDGYNGASPAGVVDATRATDWAYATGVVEIRLGDVQIMDAAPPTLTTYNNKLVGAHRTVAATFDNCCLGGVKISNCTEVETC